MKTNKQPNVIFEMRNAAADYPDQVLRLADQLDHSMLPRERIDG